jgi:hypothetical protein
VAKIKKRSDAELLFADAEAIGAEVDPKSIQTIGTLCQQVEDREARIAFLADEMASEQEKLRSLIEDELPQAMDAANCAEFKAKSGKKVEIKQLLFASISKENEEKAFEWLRKSGNRDLIKHELKTTLPREQDTLARKIKSLVKKTFKVDLDDRQTVHPQTLAAFCREQRAAGIELPDKLLGVVEKRVAKFK